jgi:hypothetical protein
MARSQPNGRLGNPNALGEAGHYMHSHGFALLFLSCVYGEEEESDRRRRLEDILTRAVQFTGKAQTSRGGWGYISAADGQDFDEGSVTVTQVQAIRAARNAGISVPKEIIDRAIKYLKDSTMDGGVIYSLASGGGGQGRPALTAAAIACGFSAGQYNSPLVKTWFKFCQVHIPIGAGITSGRFGHDEYTYYYFAQALYVLGDDGWAKMFPEANERDRLSWGKFRKQTFDQLLRSQGPDGGWTGGYIGPVYITSIYLSILQLDNAMLPLYQR